MDALGIIIGLGPKGVSILVELERRFPGEFLGIESSAIVGAWDSTFAGTSPTRTRMEYSDTVVRNSDSEWTLRTFASQHPLMDPHLIETDCVPKEVTQDYYRTVAQQAGARMLLGERVLSVEPLKKKFVVTTNRRILSTKYVVVAAGLLASKVFPEWAQHLPPSLCQHSIGHGLFTDLPGSRVLVVGGGHATPDIACRLWEAGAEVEVLVWGPGMKVNHLPYPNRYLRSGYWAKFGVLSTPHKFQELQRIQAEGPWVSPRSFADFTGLLSRSLESPRPVKYKVNTFVTQCTHTDSSVTVKLNDGSTEHFDRVVCATGFHPQISHLRFLDGTYTSAQVYSGYPRIADDYSLDGSPQMYFLGQLAALGPRGVVEGILYHTQGSVISIADSISSREMACVSNL